MNRPEAVTSETLVDTHAHLAMKAFDGDREAVIQRAFDKGIEIIVAIGSGDDFDENRASVDLAAKYDEIYAVVGVHPHDASSVTDETRDEIEHLCLSPGVVAVGETGLDFHYLNSPAEVQERVFRDFIRLAKKVRLPLVIHSREAADDTVRILEEEGAADVGGVIHCFSGSLEMAMGCLELGFMISFTGTVTFRNAGDAAEIIRRIPIESIMVETDAPYLAPVPMRGRRNEPAYVRWTAEKIAEIKGLSTGDISRITTQNARRLFGIVEDRQEPQIAYLIRNSLYLNITNRCNNDCDFCPKGADCTVKGHNLRLDNEPTAAEVIEAIGDPSAYDEVVFCGFGEPLVRLDLVLEVGRWLKERGAMIRINTDGQAGLRHGRDILPELHGVVDSLSVSLNFSNAHDYQRHCRSIFGEKAYDVVKAFIRSARSLGIDVTATVVEMSGVDVPACRRIAQDELGAAFRAREHRNLGG
ncbi:TatD family hydrolase [Thermodesulfobacteriota bacterium]